MILGWEAGASRYYLCILALLLVGKLRSEDNKAIPIPTPACDLSLLPTALLGMPLLKTLYVKAIDVSR